MDGLTTFAAKYLLLLPILVVIYIWLQLKGQSKKRFLFLLVGSAILSFILAEIGRHLYYNPRPFLSDGIQPLFVTSRDNGFPSDHTLAAGVLAFAALSYSRKLGGLLLLLAVLIGWARVAAGVHHAIDVVGSLAITAASFWLVNYLVRSRMAGHEK